MQLPSEDIIQEQVLESLIVEEIQLQRAERIGLQLSDQMLNSAIANISQQNSIPFEKLPEALAAEGIDYAEYRRDIRKDLILEQLRDIEVIRKIIVSPREIDVCLEDFEDGIVSNSEYNLSHILISAPESATIEDFTTIEREAEDIHEQLIAGANFGEIAIEFSDSQTGLDGGSLGWRKGSELPTIFSDIVKSLKVDEISRPYRTKSGFHIVKINDLRSTFSRSEVEQMKVRHILVVPNEIIDNATAKQKLTDAQREIQNGKNFSDIATILSEDPGSKDSGGDMGWVNPGTFVEEFENVAKNLEIGVVSEPFQSRFGWHILEVLGRRTHDNTEERKESICSNSIRNSKFTDEVELWLRRIRDEAYVEIRI
jgi:peptidyl-prolyl cis-trans isomerase SurA